MLPGSPAEEAGFAVGDRLLEDGGIDVDDGEALARRHPWARVGEERTYLVEREGEPVALTLTFARQPPRQGGALLLLRPDRSRLSGGPGSPSSSTSSPSSPAAKRAIRRRGALWLLYLPPALISLYSLGVLVLRPDRDSLPYTLTAVLLLIYLVAYFGMAIVAMVHGFARASARKRTAFGLRWMLFGTVPGIALLVLVLLLRLLLPRLTLPAAHFYAVAMILVPLSFALAVRRRYRDAPAG